MPPPQQIVGKKRATNEFGGDERKTEVSSVDGVCSGRQGERRRPWGGGGVAARIGLETAARAGGGRGDSVGTRGGGSVRTRVD